MCHFSVDRIRLRSPSHICMRTNATAEDTLVVATHNICRSMPLTPFLSFIFDFSHLSLLALGSMFGKLESEYDFLPTQTRFC